MGNGNTMHHACILYLALALACCTHQITKTAKQSTTTKTVLGTLLFQL
jgi:hypothetical protein